jgi:NCS1 family nucleobase:cation symporter-1
MFVGAWFLPLAEYESFLLLIGSAFVPLLGVLAADFFVLRGRRYEPDELLRGDPGAITWPFLIVWILGLVLYLAISGVPAFNLTGLAPWLGASLPSFVVSFALLVALGRLVERRPAAAAARP